MEDRPTVITVGMDTVALRPALVERLSELGFPTESIEEPEALPATLARHRRATIVVYSKHRFNGAHHTLVELANLYRGTPVVVLVDRIAFSEYYELTRDGAMFYKQLAEGLDDIAQTVTHVAERYSA